MDWKKPMLQTFEYYIVDPMSWSLTRRIMTVTSCTITRDLDNDTLSSATIDCDEDLTDNYVRVYLIATQSGVTEKYSLGTFLVASPHDAFDGFRHNTSLDAYSPLIELKDQYPPIGFALPKSTKIMNVVNTVCKERLRAPVTAVSDTSTTYSDFVAEPTENWLSFVKALANRANYYINLDSESRVIFTKNTTLDEMKPKVTYTDDSSSILYKNITNKRDLFDVPNVVEVVWSGDGVNLFATVENNDSNSPTSIKTRGRRVVHRETNPSIAGTPSASDLKVYAKNLLKRLSSFEYEITYTHGYTPALPGDCVLLDYKRAGLKNVKVRVTSQTIRCVPGCPVEETAKFTSNLLTTTKSYSTTESSTSPIPVKFVNPTIDTPVEALTLCGGCCDDSGHAYLYLSDNSTRIGKLLCLNIVDTADVSKWTVAYTTSVPFGRAVDIEYYDGKIYAVGMGGSFDITMNNKIGIFDIASRSFEKYLTMSNNFIGICRVNNTWALRCYPVDEEPGYTLTERFDDTFQSRIRGSYGTLPIETKDLHRGLISLDSKTISTVVGKQKALSEILTENDNGKYVSTVKITGHTQPVSCVMRYADNTYAGYCTDKKTWYLINVGL